MYLIFDFDGTLIDSFQCLVKKFNFLAEEFNFHKINPDELENLRHLTSKEFIKHLEIPVYKIPKILHKARKSLHSEIQILSPFENLPEILQQLYETGHLLGIVTSNSKENVETWLTYHHLRHCFQFIHAESNFFGKKQALKKVLKLYQIQKSQAFYIGDETRDIEAAKQCEIHSVAVTWGFNSEKVLLQYEPDYVVKTPEAIIALAETAIPTEPQDGYYQRHVFFCINQRDEGHQCCANKNAEVLREYAKKRLKALKLTGMGKMRINQSGCLGRCKEGPVLVIYPDGVWYTYTNEQDIDEIIEKHLLQGKKVERLLLPTILDKNG